MDNDNFEVGNIVGLVDTNPILKKFIKYLHNLKIILIFLHGDFLKNAVEKERGIRL